MFDKGKEKKTLAGNLAANKDKKKVGNETLRETPRSFGSRSKEKDKLSDSAEEEENREKEEEEKSLGSVKEEEGN
ncbi:hypothetical protein AT5G17305 [Arabidopsis thaliana]|jgi:hypothetical protein|uniref:Uncharacterized protein n=1 Tax=Arabidopsis thaliana TaxID=3702 RepID=A0A1P8BGC5_ARATH|nr:uncharacterized protein AT5G17305 [Arabidopsis thaliana]ANM70644.1 hypothetical protein AT5G17305 [Arabidopsis thaliana]|eukprot:NP_001332235.1 hypothetical protein AT5G17305 [Arabidopsis thaliana]